MTSNWRLTALVLAIGCAGLLTGARRAQAATATQTMAVSMTIAANTCFIQTNPLAFPPLNLGAPTNLTATTTMAVNCSAGAPWNIDIDGGLNNNLIPALGTGRFATNGGTNPSYFQYLLYKDVAQTLLWGTSDAGTVLTGTGTGAAQTISVYGKSGGYTSSPASGTYTDTVKVIVTF